MTRPICTDSQLTVENILLYYVVQTVIRLLPGLDRLKDEKQWQFCCSNDEGVANTICKLFVSGRIKNLVNIVSDLVQLFQ